MQITAFLLMSSHVAQGDLGKRQPHVKVKGRPMDLQKAPEDLANRSLLSLPLLRWHPKNNQET